MAFELGIITFGEVTPDLSTGTTPSPQTRVRETVEQAVLADQVGLDVFGVGEHHRSDFIASSPVPLLAAAAARTERIRLTSAVTVLSSDDPVRVFQDFATLDLISDGRAELIAGRGSYTESFPLFGYSLADYAELFAEKLDLLLAIRGANPVTWSGRHRPPLVAADVAPRPVQDELPIWVGVGGTPSSAVRAGALGLPMALAILLGPVNSHLPTVGYYRQAAAEAGHDPATLPISINTHGYVGRTSQAARDTMFPYFSVGMRENNHQRGRGFDLPRRAFDAQATPGGGLVVGSPQEVIDKIATFAELYGVTRANVQLGFGGVPQREHLAAIELFGSEVAPVLRREVRVPAAAGA
ncbi:LLM class flavin-dependent oxidoreductase [Modestobacter roseus]|uniref:Putative LLM family oxidoreductase n=1 Tax=Modestobacter roseus TaxID=1181884 RepID=A0A562IQQ9_9ACTN|nr:LLM class flavin-dependent oxidoreductase [Modestobacter roseus]MQA34673.1 LLM class flavin-dependent oxidoreductase [Modestobacter roseus]TWH73146.1 putative LLM family oxidoreductase [Modestobacter roseus]